MEFDNIAFAMEEILFDPQTSGGLLLAVDKDEANLLVEELRKADMPAAIVGEIKEKENITIKVVNK